ncbi:MAG: AAA family ATPase [Clostridiales bacterium]|nr:AAA family ATPase [Clostridiales bacterium]
MENGLFKELCINAEKEFIKNLSNQSYVDMIHADSSIWKVSLGERKSDEIYDECIEGNDIAIGWLSKQDLSESTYDDILEMLGEGTSGGSPTQSASVLNILVNEMSTGDIVMIYDRPQTVRMIGVVESDYRYDTKYSYRHRRSIKWFKDLTYPINIYKYNKNVRLTLKAIYKLSRLNVSDVVDIVVKNRKTEQRLEDKQQIKPYYLVIDEINRGNIAKIFGELITLIEQDKRGRVKSLLPYSKKYFSIPSNLFVIGTMNTADRSIAAIDTALRRRFTFVEIEPDSKIITQAGNSIVNDNIDLAKLLDALNKKIMEKYDRDHRIGHAYFMEIDSLKNLYQTWYYKLLPLLGEYFYNDIDSITAVVGKAFYGEHGNVKQLSLKKKDSGKSEFEEKLIEIYKVRENG